jgi:alpha-L-fucosidase
VPQKAPDATDSVVVLPIVGDIKAIPGRLLSNDMPNQLLTFDGEAHGHVQFGDGKTARYYVTGFSGPDDCITWDTRLNQPADFDVSVKYTTASQDDSSEFKVTVADQILPAHLAPTSSPTDIQELKLGEIALPGGDAQIRIQPEGKVNGPSVNIFEIDLAPHAK